MEQDYYYYSDSEFPNLDNPNQQQKENTVPLFDHANYTCDPIPLPKFVYGEIMQKNHKVMIILWKYSSGLAKVLQKLSICWQIVSKLKAILNTRQLLLTAQLLNG